MGLVGYCSGGIGILNLILPLLSQISSVCGKFMDIPSEHTRLEFCGGAHMWKNIFDKAVASLQTHHKRCKFGFFKRGICCMGVNQVSNPLSPYCINVCSNIQDSPSFLAGFGYC